MAENIPLFTPGQIIENKLDELNARMAKLYDTYMEKNAPLDQWGVPMSWNKLTGKYDLSPFDAYGNYR